MRREDERPTDSLAAFWRWMWAGGVWRGSLRAALVLYVAWIVLTIIGDGYAAAHVDEPLIYGLGR